MSHREFFKHSAWMMAATLVGGVMMWGVHFLAKKIPESDYAAVVTLNTFLILVPTVPLQMVFARWTARAVAEGRHGEISTILRGGVAGLLVVWVCVFVAAVTGLGFFQALLRIDQPVSILATLVAVLGALLLPIALGVLQGLQRFPWFGLCQVIAGFARLGFCTLVVLVFWPTVSGVMLGIALGMVVTLVMAFWGARDYVLSQGEHVCWGTFVREAVPIVLAFVGFQFLFSVDTVFVKANFDSEHVAYYGAAGVLSRGLVWMVGPIAAVMFPKIVHHAVRSEKTNLMELTLASTAVISGLAALVLWVAGPVVIRFVYKHNYVQPTMRLLGMYVLGMILMSMVNVLVNNLVARGRFGFVPWLLCICGVYTVFLSRCRSDLRDVLVVLVLMAVVAMAVCAWFTWGTSAASTSGSDARRQYEGSGMPDV